MDAGRFRSNITALVISVALFIVVGVQGYLWFQDRADRREARIDSVSRDMTTQDLVRAFVSFEKCRTVIELSSRSKVFTVSDAEQVIDACINDAEFRPDEPTPTSSPAPRRGRVRLTPRPTASLVGPSVPLPTPGTTKRPTPRPTAPPSASPSEVCLPNTTVCIPLSV